MITIADFRNIAIYQALQNVLDNTPNRLPSFDGRTGVHDETLKAPKTTGTARQPQESDF